MRSLSAVVVRALDVSFAMNGCTAVCARLWSHRGRLILLGVLVLPLIVAACGGKGGHGGSWG